ncbi:hypothetical protein BHE74_00028952 [Ensete ventricosum]|uniref:Uncharacterized protein n=1 Tax=Ensete ventricosum TaxID=4639 RepID=A0A426XPW9_ENSVE|nr:hypothetical protein B296_00044689 [Ensete ventricosum]RWV81905.1 hypothetical protein GW17_00056638 [Ensete ventricosum]RWW63850.1 hypothetical protein BHE74_00028952 [Ensete ventricosum]RZR71737.1 hypothetical protein BHM03_00006941 [Ensete ventricosum]
MARPGQAGGGACCIEQLVLPLDGTVPFSFLLKEKISPLSCGNVPLQDSKKETPPISPGSDSLSAISRLLLYLEMLDGHTAAAARKKGEKER